MTTADLTIYTGTDCALSLSVTNANGTAVNLAGASIVSQIRATPTSPVLAAFYTVIANATGGQATLSLTNTQTNALPATGIVPLHYDILLIQGSLRTLLCSGNVTVVASITQV